MESLNSLVAFVHAAEQLSFVSAGRQLGISASAVGKSIAKLEQSMGARLFHRSTRRISLTEEGAAFYERCRRILDDLRDAQTMLSDAMHSPRGRLRVSVPIIGYRFLLPAIPAFRERYPDIELDIDFNDRIVDIVEEGLDAAIRSGSLSDSNLMSRRLGPFRFVICASQTYLARNGTPQVPQELATHDCLRFRFPSSGKLQEWRLANTEDCNPFLRPPILTCNNMEALRGAVIAGLGIAYMPDFLARDAVQDGVIQTILDDHLVEPGQFSIVWPSSRLVSPRLRVFIDYVTEVLFPEEQG